MYGAQECFNKTASRAWFCSTVMGSVSLITGLLFSNALCDMDLAEWNVVNAALCAALASCVYFSQNISSRTLELGYRVSIGQASKPELLAEGMTTAAVSVGLVALPLTLLLWGVRGFTTMGSGICAESAPLFFGISLVEMIVQVGGISYVVINYLQATGYDLERFQSSAKEFIRKVKDIALDLSCNGLSYARQAVDSAVPAIKCGACYVAQTGAAMYESRPRIFTFAYWQSLPESQYLLG